MNERWTRHAVAAVLFAGFALMVAAGVVFSPHPAQETAMTLSIETLPARSGPRPKTTPTNPHTQLDQIAPEALQQAVADYMFGLSCVAEVPSRISVPGARAMWLEDSCHAGPREAFMIGREFCHIHPAYDGSLHLNLPLDVATAAIEKGWAENHPIALRGLIPMNVVMVYGPRDDAELDVVKWLVATSHAFAHPPAEPG